MICLKKHDLEISALRSQVEGLLIENTVLRTKLELLQPENAELKALSRKQFDRIMTGMGFAPLFAEPTPYVAPTEPTVMRNTTRDLLDEAQKAEDRANSEYEKQKREDAIAAARELTQ